MLRLGDIINSCTTIKPSACFYEHHSKDVRLSKHVMLAITYIIVVILGSHNFRKNGWLHRLEVCVIEHLNII